MNKSPCFIRKNTPELRDKLAELGYERSGSWNVSTDNVIQTLCPFHNGYITFPDSDYERLIKLYPNQIACGDNERLFLAIAALRDDSDKNQWFVTEADQAWVNLGMYAPRGSFELCLTDDRYFGMNKEFCNSIIPAHKATIEELIKEFL